MRMNASAAGISHLFGADGGEGRRRSVGAAGPVAPGHVDS